MTCVREHCFVEYNAYDPKRDAYRYDQHMDLIETPVLVVTGEFDKVANDQRIEQDVFEQVSSADKTYNNIELTGHGDMIVGLRAEEELFPLVEEWIGSRM